MFQGSLISMFSVISLSTLTKDGIKKYVSITKRSSLNPNATIFVPYSLRDASSNTNSSFVRNELTGNYGATVTHTKES